MTNLAEPHTNLPGEGAPHVPARLRFFNSTGEI